MSQPSVKEALIAKLHQSVMETAHYTCETLNRKHTLAELANNDPSFEKIKEVCEALLDAIRTYTSSDVRIQQVEEVIEILEQIVDAIPRKDNPMIVDCTCHLEQFLEMHVRKRADAA